MIARIRRRVTDSGYVRDILWQLSGNGMAQIIGVAAMPLITRLYTPTDLAALNLFAQVVTGLSILLTFRIEYLVMLAKTDTEARQMVRLAGYAGALICVASAMPAWAWRREFAALLGAPDLAPWLLLAPFTAWLLCMSVALQQAVQRQQDYRLAGLSEVMNKGGYVGSALAGSAWTPNTAGLMGSMAAGLAAKCLLLVRTLKRTTPTPRDAVARHSVAPIFTRYFRLAGAMSYSNVVAMITSAAPMVYFANAYGANALGHFGLVTSTLYLPSGLLGNAIGQVYYQRAAQAHLNAQPFDRLWRATAWQLIRLGVPLYIAIAILSPFAYPLIFGSQWTDAGTMAAQMSIAAGMSFITSPLDRTSLVTNAWWYHPIWHTMRAITTLAAIQIAHAFAMPVLEFLWLLVAQMSCLYLIDWFAGRHFAHSQPHLENDRAAP